MQLTTILLGLAASASAFKVTFTNKCSYKVEVRAAFGVFVCDLSPGQANACEQWVGENTRGLFKHTKSDEANLFEYSTINGPNMKFIWYDVSNIPPMPGNCNSYEDCKKHTGKTGYNIPVYVTPTRNAGVTCRELQVTAPNDNDAYLFPADNTKTHACPMNTDFHVTYCPESSPVPPPSQCQTQANTDYFGNDIGRFQVHGNGGEQVGQCCDGCNKNDDCVGFSVSGGFCYLKNALANKVGAPGVTAGIKPNQWKCTQPKWNTDYFGNDIGRVPVSNGPWDRYGQCCDACTQRGDCAAWTVNGDWCYLKSKAEGPSYSATAFSGRRASR